MLTYKDEVCDFTLAMRQRLIDMLLSANNILINDLYINFNIKQDFL